MGVKWTTECHNQVQPSPWSFVGQEDTRMFRNKMAGIASSVLTTELVVPYIVGRLGLNISQAT